MAPMAELEVQRRQVLGKATRRLRRQGIIPANIFGHKEPPLAIQLEAAAFERFRRQHKAASLVTLRIPGDSFAETALVHSIQRDPCTGKILHVDFFRVSQEEEVEVKVPLHLVGEAPAVKESGGTLLRLLDALEVACRATEIPEAIEVDVSPLVEVEQIIHAGEIKLPPNVRLLTDPHEPVVKAEPPAVEVEEAAEAAPAAQPAASAQPQSGESAAKES
uniref:Large ribosomal subunit protein bL25 n=1 Tax=Thermogemmatispora argillosa TaxID=2045280 RepID=A0A455SZG6_9CHLR|nr:50S ribosomal protein L25 [Thermogemmatispora argillosa]